MHRDWKYEVGIGSWTREMVETLAFMNRTHMSNELSMNDIKGMLGIRENGTSSSKMDTNFLRNYYGGQEENAVLRLLSQV